jgi:aspartate racemase
MKTIGLIGGLTWLSTLEYYRLLNEQVNQRVGGFDAASIILHSVNFGDIKKLTEAQDWDAIAQIICDAAKKIEIAGADCLLIGANTMHKIADKVQAVVHIPVIHIAAVTAKSIQQKKLTTVALLGTKYTMQLDFYTNILKAEGITCITPDAVDMEYINTAIYTEMSKGMFNTETKKAFINIIDKMKSQGAEGAILGCTEIPILLQQQDVSIPIFDTTAIHVNAAVDFALS